MIRACLALLALPLATPAWAELPSVSITNTLTVEGHADNGNAATDDDGYFIILDRLNLQTGTEQLDLGVRLDAVGFSDTAEGTAYASDARPERLTARYRQGDVELTVGDYYRQLGRGLLLSIRKVDEVGLDLSLRGVDARWAPTGHTLGLFAAVLNPANLDAVSQKPVDDVGDLVAGLSYELGTLDQVVLGAHALYLQPGERLDTINLDYTLSGGAWAEVHELVEGLNLYGELDVQGRRLAGTDELGWAGYLTADLALGDLALLLEGLWLEDFEQKGSRNTALSARFDVNQVPTLERVDQEVPNNRDVKGVRLRAEYGWGDGRWLAYVNGVLRLNDLGETSELRQVHAYAGGEHHFDEDLSKLIVSGGYRHEDQEGKGTVKKMAHGEVDLLKSVGEGVGLHVTGNLELRTQPGTSGGDDKTWIRGSTFAGVEWADLGALTVELGYDTEKDGQRNVFVAGILGLTLSDMLTVRLLGGTQRGGIKCANGVCRDFPEFAGGRAEIIARL